MATITTSTTPDQASYYAEIERLPRLSAEEEAQLLHDLHLAQQTQAAKARLIEGYLPRVVTLARQYDRRYRVITFDDLVQEGSLALMQAIDKCATMPLTKSLHAYVGTVVRSAFARAIATDAPIHMPNSTWHYIHATGRAHEFVWMQTVSMDRIPTHDDRSLADLLAAPALRLPTGEQQQEAQDEEEQRRHLTQLLPLLAERQRQVLTLRYGLDEADARAHGTAETARLLGISPSSAYSSEQQALRKLRALFQAEREAATRRSEAEYAAVLSDACQYHALPPGLSSNERKHEDQQARLQAAYQQLQAQGLPITAQRLSKAAHADPAAASVFVQGRIPQSAERASIRAIPQQQRLEEGYARLLAAGATLSISGLVAEAHIDGKAARAFLQERGVPIQVGGVRRKAASISVERSTGHATC